MTSMPLTLAPAPPANWKAIARDAVQLPEFAEAGRRLGYRPYYAARGSAAALVQIRDPLPALGLFGRAYVYPSGEDAAFLEDVVAALARRRIPFVRIGNTMWGARERAHVTLPRRGVTVITRHTPVLDVTRDERALLAGMDGAERKIRKAEREGVEVTEAQSLADVEAYHRLSSDTADRIRARASFTELPLAFFVDIWQQMVPAGHARFFLARHHGELIAGNLFLIHGDTMLYYQGASTRDRAQTLRQAPAACFWTAIREARKLGLARFDFGGCTPTADPTDPRHGVWEFKKKWGGELVTFYNAEILLAPRIVGFQQRIVAPLWQSVHPLLWRLGGRAATSAT
jgi:peptidoglycan pentaglycine glycine transferase (the first glycine)